MSTTHEGYAAVVCVDPNNDVWNLRTGPDSAEILLERIYLSRSIEGSVVVQERDPIAPKPRR